MAKQSVHTCLKGFIKSESFGYNMKGYFNFEIESLQIMKYASW